MKPLFKQIAEGSLILGKPMEVAIEMEDGNQYEYHFKIYENNILRETSNRTKASKYHFYPDQYISYVAEVDIYEKDRIIHTLKGLKLDFMEDFVLIKDTWIAYEKEEIVVKVATELNLEKEYYAYYLKKNQVVIEKKFYSKEREWHFKPQGSGNYCVQVFVRHIKNNGIEDKVITHTEHISI